MSDTTTVTTTDLADDLLPADYVDGLPSLDELAFTLGVEPGDPAVEGQGGAGEGA